MKAARLKQMVRMKSKGQLTIPDLLAVMVLLFLFAAFTPAMIDALGNSFQGANPLTQLTLVTVPALILVLIIAALWTLQEPDYAY